ncbi:MAG: 16S rRNA (cytosine(1402)-N(4))-methyltransferase RsmH [Patescibacteria group bacterium]|nr:16S rRNA (cytosine(1402)-N(4))-methyltransferase RsmH [Patescibacteria group bacterium]MDD5490550.1 16S rRNA (cytosine(1402)-N(4))-methyltransferase RsmH [Patescibacteria group bacterium]
MAGQFHYSVLKEEVLRYLNPQPNENFIDGTLGDGGHSEAILEKTSPAGKLLGIDLDERALKKAATRLQPFKNRIILVRDNFANLKNIVYANRFSKFDGLLLDLGLSRGELDDPERGFSFLSAGPLDMRFDKRSELKAEDIVNNYSEQELARILREYGEERFAKSIARSLVRERAKKRITTTAELVKIIEQSVPPRYLHNKTHFATRTFQALRIEVNGELDNLKKVLPDVLELLAPGGRVAVISFHSLEDRIVKNFLKESARGCICPPRFPRCVCGHKPSLTILTKKAVQPGERELKINPASRSAKLRVAVKI